MGYLQCISNDPDIDQFLFYCDCHVTVKLTMTLNPTMIKAVQSLKIGEV